MRAEVHIKIFATMIFKVNILMFKLLKSFEFKLCTPAGPRYGTEPIFEHIFENESVN
jgi:hypothetical protein